MNLNKFNKYKKSGKAQQLINKNKELWMYTRVSSKEQTKKKYSIDGQVSSIKIYALKNGYTITKEHGGTYESAKGDLTRKEFNQLLDNVKKSKRKPHAIAINFISRFSRSGGGAISLVEELVNRLGVHLIETSTGLTTENEKDRLDIYDKLLDSRRENMVRLERTIPAMKDFLEEGFWLGRPPKGYTMYGERVVNFKNRIEGQKLVINEEGNILKNAWHWKADGMTDADIRRKLLNIHQYTISKQNLSAMWRKPFYVGVSTNAMLDSPTKGNWPPLVNEKTWDQVQKRLEGAKRKSGYDIAPLSEHRPLTNFIYCADCGSAITSYVVKKKQIHYYKCQHGKGGNMNAFTTPRSRKPGVNDSFIEYLNQFKLSDNHRKLLTAQILHITQELKNEQKTQFRNLEKELKRQQNKLDKLNEKFMLSDNADEETYVKLKNRLNDDISEIDQKINEAPMDLSNQEKLVDKALKFCQNLSNNWASGDIHQKIKIQKTLFPEGLIINPENRHYRTNKMNSLLTAISVIAKDSETSENKKATQKSGLSGLVAGTGLTESNLNELYRILKLTICL